LFAVWGALVASFDAAAIERARTRTRRCVDRTLSRAVGDGLRARTIDVALLLEALGAELLKRRTRTFNRDNCDFAIDAFAAWRIRPCCAKLTRFSHVVDTKIAPSTGADKDAREKEQANSASCKHTQRPGPGSEWGR
jgi:hypothetical protein